jgi:hypothetical protein
MSDISPPGAGPGGLYPNAGMDAAEAAVRDDLSTTASYVDGIQAAAHGFIVSNGPAVVGGHGEIGRPPETQGD